MDGERERFLDHLIVAGCNPLTPWENHYLVNVAFVYVFCLLFWMWPVRFARVCLHQTQILTESGLNSGSPLPPGNHFLTACGRHHDIMVLFLCFLPPRCLQALVRITAELKRAPSDLNCQ